MRLSIRRKMILFIGVPSILIIIGAMLWVLDFAQSHALRAHQAEMAEGATAAASRFDEHIGRAARVADSTARFVGFLPNLNDGQIYGILTGNVEDDEHIFGAAMAFEPGTYKGEGILFSPYVHRNPGGEGLAKMDINADVYDWYHDEQWQWWHRPKRSGRGEWTDPYFDEGAGNILMTTYSVPFERDSKFTGVTTVDIDLGTLHADISSMIPESSDFYIIGSEGQIIFSPVAAEIMGRSIFEILDTSGRSNMVGEVRRMIGGGHDEMTLENLIGEGRQIYAYAPIPSPGWTLIIYMPEELALAEFNLRKRILSAVFLSAALMILGVTLLASGRLAQPIRLLRERVLRIADGEAGVRVDDLRTGDEIEELAGAFGIMQAKVADREAKLENARETTLTELLESAPDAMIIADSEGRICRLNSQMGQIFGYASDELMGMSIEQLMPERYRGGHGGHMAAYFKNPTARQMGAALELYGQRKNGEEFPIEIGLSPFHEPGGVKVVSAIRDITRRRDAEGELRKLNQAVEQGSAMVFMTDRDGLIEYVNRRFTEVTGYLPDEVIGQTPRILKSGFQDPSVYRDVWETLGAGQEWRGEFCNQRKDGTLFWASAALAPIRDHDGEVSHFIAIEEDISEERKIAEEIKEKEQRFRTLVDNIPGTVYRCRNHHDWTMQFISDDVEQLTGYPAHDFIGNKVRTFDSVIHLEDRELVAERVAEAIGRKTEWGIEYRIDHKDGGIRWVGETGRAIYRDDGSVDYLDGVIVDISLRKEMEAQLHLAREQAEAANRAKSEFLSHMSHELRTPLNGVLGYAQILNRSRDVTEKQRRSLDAIVDCGDHLLSLINDVLDLSKIEAGRIEVDEGPCDLHRLINGVANILSSKAKEKGIGFSVEVSPEVPVGISTDAAKLRQILVNLLGNAVKFTAGGAVSLRVVEAPTGTLRFEVCDSGVGIADDEIEVIFDPFKQVEAGKAAGGTGLGLAITKRLAEMLGGALEVKSKLGEGSTFTLTIPLVEVHDAAIGALEDGEAEGAFAVLAPGQDLNILVVDDRETNRDILEQLLGDMGFRVALAGDGQEALDAIREGEPFDLVLMDVRMPRMNGIDATRHIREDERTKHLKVIAVTASVFPQFEDKAAEAGFDDYLGKPFRTSELVAKIKTHLGAEFVAGEVPPAAASARSPEARATPEAGTELAAGVRDELRAALKIRNLTAINAVAARLEADPATAAAGALIGKLARGFDFKGLAEIAED